MSRKSMSLFVTFGTVLTLALLGAHMRSTVPVTLTGHTNWVNSVAFSPDGRLLASGSQDTTIKIWDVATGKEVASLEPPEGRYLGPEKSKGTVYDPVKGRQPPFIDSVSFSSNGRLLVSGASDKTIRLWDIPTKRQVLKIELEDSGPFGRGNKVFGVSLSPDSKVVASASFDGIVRLWAVEGGKLIRAFRGHTEPVYAVAFSHDGKMLASCGADQSVRLWDVRSGSTSRTLKSEKDYVRSVAFSPDDRLLASGGGDINKASELTELMFWEVSSGGRLTVLEGQEGPVHSVAFRRDGRILASGGGDPYRKTGELILWNVGSGRLLARLHGHKNLVTSVAFSPNGRLIASGSADKTVKLWDVTKLLGEY